MFFLFGGQIIAESTSAPFSAASTTANIFGAGVLGYSPLSFQVTAIGSSGGVLGGGAMIFIKGNITGNVSGVYLTPVNGSGTPVTVNTTTALALDVQIACGTNSASNTIQALGVQARIRG
jgi:hypothetical protein